VRFLDALAARLARSDMLQALTLLLAVLLVVLAFSWPGGNALVNEAWFSLAPIRHALLALAAAAFGASLAPATAGAGVAWRHEARVTLAALLVWALVTLPFEVIAHAASYPAVSLAWGLLTAPLTVVAYYGLGALLARGARALRAAWALPLLVPGSLVLLAWVDLQLGATLLNPWTAPLDPSPAYLAVMGGGAILTAMGLTLERRPRRAEPA